MTGDERKRAIQRLSVRGQVKIGMELRHKKLREYTDPETKSTTTEFCQLDTPTWVLTLTRYGRGPVPYFDRFARAAGWLGFGDLQEISEDLDEALEKLLEASRPPHVDLYEAVYGRQCDIREAEALFRILARAS